MKNQFNIESFAATCKAAMQQSSNAQNGMHQALESCLKNNDMTYIIDTLEAAIPVDASIGEMIVHQSDELTMLYARIPGRF